MRKSVKENAKKLLQYTPEEYKYKLMPTLNLDITQLHESVTRRFLDDKQVFDLWIELGNSGRVYEYFVENEILSPRTGRPPAECSLLTACFRYISKNFPDAIAKIKHAYEVANEPYDEEAVIKGLITKALGKIGSKGLVKWIVDGKLYEKYFDYIPKSIGLGEHQYQSMLKSNGDYDVYRMYEGTLPKTKQQQTTTLKSIQE